MKYGITKQYYNKYSICLLSFEIDFDASTEILTDENRQIYLYLIYFNCQLNLMYNSDNEIIVIYTFVN